MSNYDRDVFVSYSSRDGDWVRGTLVPHLKKNGVTVYIDDDFPPGPSSVENMEDAVRRCHYTIVVLSKEWVASVWSQYEGLLAAQLDIRGGKSRLIPVMIEKCDPPWRIEIRTRLEFIDDSRFSRQMERLVRTIRGDDGPVQVAGVGLRTIVDLLRVETVRTALASYGDRFRNVPEEIEKLAAYKAVHDQLHKIQASCEYGIVREAKLLEDDPTAAVNLAIHLSNLKQAVETVHRLTTRSGFVDDMQLDWVEQLATAHGKMEEAAALGDGAGVVRHAKAVDAILGQKPAWIDMRLNATARALHLPDVVKAIRSICDQARASNITADDLDDLEAARDAIELLSANLDDLVREHGRWQIADADLRRVEKIMEFNLNELIDSWQYLKSSLSSMSAGQSAAQLQRHGEAVDHAIAHNDAAKMRYHFRLYRQQALNRFIQVDSTLNEHCRELRNIGEPIAFIARVL